MNDKRLYHTVARKLEKLIDDGIFLPGSRLPAERELALKFGVSRVTVREAEIALQAKGRIRIRTGSGVYVLDHKDKKKKEFPDVSAFELTEARALFESEAAALAAGQIDDETLNELDKYIEIMAANDPNDEKGERADRDFHRTIAQASGNPAISHVIEVLWKMRTETEAVRAAHETVCSKDDGSRAKEHSEILEALRNRDPAAARSSMRQHFTRLLTSMLDVSEEKALEDLRRRASESRQRYLRDSTI